MTNLLPGKGLRLGSKHAPDRSQPAITFDRVSVHYGRGRGATAALVDFSLRVRQGEAVALLGPSGSGKSTALKALAGFVRPASGVVRLSGRDVTNLPPAQRGLGVVVQSYALFPHMRVRDNVAFGLRAARVRRGEVATRVTESLDMVGMAKYADRLPRELSGGQQQRIAIARALAIRPDVLLLDEPLAALDVQLRRSMVGELQQLRKSLPDTAMLYVTHDQSEALAIADRIAVMRDARLVDVDTTEALWQQPPSEFTASFLGNANLLPCTVIKTAGGAALVSVGGVEVKVDAPAGQRWAPGTNAMVCARPHALTLDRPVRPGEQSLRGTVTAVQWQGASTRLTIAVNGLPGQPIEVDLPGAAHRAVGSVVSIQVPTGAGVLVPPAGALPLAGTTT